MNIYYFAPIPYDFLMQRPQYLAKELSKQYSVIYIEPTVSPIRWLLKGGEKPVFVSEKISANLNVVRLNGLFTLPRTLNAFDLKLNLQWELMQLKKLVQETDMLWVGYCGWWPLISRLKCKHLIYDRMDDQSLLINNALLSKQLAKNDKKIMQSADCIFASAGSLYDEALTLNKRAYLVPNAVTKDFAQNTAIKDKVDGKKAFGYVGMIDSWFDAEAILAIAKADESHEVVLVGPNNIPEIQHQRVKYVGRVPKTELPEWISGFDVCLYPFKQNRLLETINPVKIYEYLAMNKPVLAVDSREIRAFGDLVQRYSSYDDLNKLSKQHFPSPFTTDEARHDFITENNWSKRGKKILAILDNL